MGRPLHPWEIVTLDQLSEPARLLITKMARIAARDFFEEQRSEWLDVLRAELPGALWASLEGAEAPPVNPNAPEVPRPKLFNGGDVA